MRINDLERRRYQYLVLNMRRWCEHRLRSLHHIWDSHNGVRHRVHNQIIDLVNIIRIAHLLHHLRVRIRDSAKATCDILSLASIKISKDHCLFVFSNHLSQFSLHPVVVQLSLLHLRLLILKHLILSIYRWLRPLLR